MKLFKILFVALILAVLPGCETIGGLYVKKSAAEKKLEDIKTEYTKKVEEEKKVISEQKDKVIESLKAERTASADAFYAINYTFTKILSPLRTELLMNNYAVEGWAAIGHQMPSYQKLVEINERVNRELDETKTSMADLVKEHDKVMTENQKLSEATKEFERKLTEQKQAYSVLQDDYINKTAEAQNNLNKYNNEIIAQQNQDKESLKALNALKTKFSIVLGILALIGIGGAIYSPVFKDKLGIFGAACGLASIGIWYIQPYMVGIAVGLVLLSLGIWACLKYHKEEKLSDRLVLGLQNVKEKSEDTWNLIKGDIQESLKKYVNQGGKPVSVVDEALEKHIDQKLAEYERK